MGFIVKQEPRTAKERSLLRGQGIQQEPMRNHPIRELPFLLRNLVRPIQNESFVDLKYVDSKTEKIFAIENLYDGKCPFCSWNAGSAKKIKKHCLRFHSDNFDLRIVEPHKGSENGSKTETPSVRLKHTFLRRRAKNCMRPQRCCRLKVTHDTWKQHMEKVNGFSLKIPPSKVGEIEPKHAYYHARTKLPAVSLHQDSDDESNPWLDEWGEARLNTLADVQPGEKRFQNLWDRFSRGVLVTADTDTHKRTLEFIRLNAKELKGLRMQLLKHAMALWENKRISRDQMLACMVEYDKVQKVVNSSDLEIELLD
eukprot:scaffold1319_cov126-Cylindrotheca_fusiformis.AAC.45